MIYDFDRIPVIAGVTAIIHAVLLILFWWADRIGYFEMATFQSVDERRMIETAQQASAGQYLDDQQELRVIELYRRGGAGKRAKRQLAQYLASHPDSAKGNLMQAAILTDNGRSYPKAARESAEKALALGLNSPADQIMAYSIIGQNHMNAARFDQAIDNFDQGLAAARKSDNASAAAHLTFLRGVAQRRKGHFANAYEDVQSAIKLAEQNGQTQLADQYKLELETIEHQSPHSTF